VAVLAYQECAEFVSSVAYVDDGVTRTCTTLDGNTTGNLVSGIGETEVTITSSLGRKVQRIFRFVEPCSRREDDYGD
jgi:hypothetical protein